MRRILQLEAELERAHAEIEALRGRLVLAQHDLQSAVNDVHRSYRRDLVPVSRAVVHVRRR